MSCGHLCQCQHSWPSDTLGFKRDPINSEKAWLDFAVRLLSREVVGKGKGQETVWSVKCKPDWWDSAVGLAWKNPTSNPKDTKEVLQSKYSALEKCLRDEGRFPKELEEEAKLWNEGKVKELYLQTTLTSLLGKVTSLHCAVDDACKKVNEMKAKVNISLVGDITKCLNATLRATENFQRSDPAAIKRPCSQDGKENCIAGPPKSRKVEAIATLPSKSISGQVQQAPLQKATSEILAVAQKLMDKRRREKSHTVMNVKRIIPRPQSLPCSNVPIKPQSLPCSNVHIMSPLVIPVLNISAQQLNKILQTNAIRSSTQRGQSLQTSAISLNVDDVYATSAGNLGPINFDLLHQGDLVLMAPEANLIKPATTPIASVLPSFLENASSSVLLSSNETSPLDSVIEDSFCVSPNASFALSPCKTNSSPSTADGSPFTLNSLSSGPSSHEDSLSSFLLSNESSDYAHNFPLSTSPRLGDCGGLDSLSSIDISVFDSLALSSDLDTMLDLPQPNDCKSALENSLSEEDGSNFLEKYLQGL